MPTALRCPIAIIKDAAEMTTFLPEMKISEKYASGQ